MAATETNTLEVVNASKTYRMGATEVRALQNVSLRIERGDFVAIMGPSGSGKSTLMNLLGLLDTPTSGSYRINGHEVSGLDERDLARLRRQNLGFVFQQFHLLPRMTTLENVALPLFYSSTTVDMSQAERLLEKVGLGDRLNHRTNELSGGQQQRVAIARALVNSPSVIFADEPTGNLDSTSEREIMSILKGLNDQGITIVMVTHEEEIGAQAKRRIQMRDGAIQSDERRRPIDAPAAGPRSIPTATETIWTQLPGHLRQAIRTLSANKVRTALSTLGILIGVAAVITMLAIGTGAQREIERQLSSLGSNLLVLRPGSLRLGGVSQNAQTTRLSLEDARVIAAKIPTIRRTSSTVNGRAQAAYGNRNWNTEVIGVESSYPSIRSAHPAQGRFFSDGENQSRAMVAVVGATVVRELFGGKTPLGETIKLNRLNFQIIGVLPAKGGSGFRDQDDVVLIPIQTAMRRLFGKPNVDSIEIEVKAGADLDATSERLMDEMRARHRIAPSRKEDPFRIQNMADLQEALTSSSRTMSALLAAIAAISLVVGGIGIMNIMLVSVTERTREIGLRKAVGARPPDILMQFLVESIVLTMIGGILGILLGGAAAATVSGIVGWTTSISATSVLVAFFFSVSIGLIFGIYPARRASALNPIDALRSD